MKLTKEEQDIFLARLTDKGVLFAVFGSHSHGGMHTLSVKELKKYLKDPELWREKLGARQEGVSLQRYRTWLTFRLNPQCRGRTAKGKQCKNMITNSPRADEFNEDIDCYCHCHSRLV